MIENSLVANGSRWRDASSTRCCLGRAGGAPRRDSGSIILAMRDRAGGADRRRDRRQVRARRRRARASAAASGRRTPPRLARWPVLVGRTRCCRRGSQVGRSAIIGGGARAEDFATPRSRGRGDAQGRVRGGAVSAGRYAFILAGGWAAGCACYRSAAPSRGCRFGGKYRIIDFTLSNCVNRASSTSVC